MIARQEPRGRSLTDKFKKLKFAIISKMTKKFGEKTIYQRVEYHIEVIPDKRYIFKRDMDFLTGNPKEAYDKLQRLKKKYPNTNYWITKIKETRTKKPILEGELEILAKRK